MTLTKEQADKRADWFIQTAVNCFAGALGAGLGVWLGLGAVVGYCLAATVAFLIGAAICWKYEL